MCIINYELEVKQNNLFLRYLNSELRKVITPFASHGICQIAVLLIHPISYQYIYLPVLMKR